MFVFFYDDVFYVAVTKKIEKNLELSVTEIAFGSSYR